MGNGKENLNAGESQRGPAKGELPKRGRRIPGLTYADWEPVFGPRAGLFSVGGDPEFHPQAREKGPRLGCWLLFQMMQRIEGRTPEEASKLIDLIAADVRRRWAREIAAHAQFKLVSLAEIPKRDTRWIIKPLIPRREITIVDGLPGVGKSYFWQALAAALTGSKSHPLPMGLQASSLSSILILSAEDDFSEIIRPRLELMGADLGRIYTFRLKLDEDEFITEADVAGALNFIDVVMRRPPDLIVIDPLTLFFASDKRSDLNKAADVRRKLAPLIKDARKHDYAILCCRHFGKAPASALTRGLGSIDQVGTARSVIAIGKEYPKDPLSKTRVAAQSKGNRAPEMRGALRFTIDETLAPLSPFKWLDGIYEFNADMIANSEMTDTAQEERSRLREAKDFLRQMLAGGGMEVGECRRQAERAGISDRTLTRAKESLKVVAQQSGFGATKAWWWSFPSAETGALS